MADPGAWDNFLGSEPVSRDRLQAFRPADPLTSSLGAFGRAAAAQTIPTAGGVAAFPIGAELGGALGALGGPVAEFTAPIGAVAGGLATSFGAGAGLERLQRWSLDKLTDGAYSRTLAGDQAEHPIASFVGGALPQLAFMRPGAFNWRGALAGAAIGGGVEAGSEYAETGTIDPLKVGAQTAFGGLLQHNTRLGDVVQQPAVAIAAGIKSGVGATAARIGADLTVAQALRDVPDAGLHIARAAAELTDPNLSQETRISLARSRALEAALGDRRTPAEIAASHVIEGDALTEASRPAGVPADAHGEALTGGLVSAAAGEPVPEPAPSYSGDQAVANQIIRIESGGDPTAHAKGTSASGLGQFTDTTWLRLYKQEYGAQGKSDADILALKADPTIARAMTGRLVGLNVSMLQRENLPITDGNLYLAHFLGPRAMRVLHADPSTPVEQLLPREFIEKNPTVLEGKTAGEVAAWADQKMGGEGVSQAPPQGEPQVAQAPEDAVPGFDEGFDRPPADADPFSGIDMPIDDAAASEFTTSKGSRYTVHDDGTTTRDKSFHPEHGPDDIGVQPRSERTVYVTPENANQLAIFQTEGAHTMLFDEATSHLGVRADDGVHAGKMLATSVVPVETAPREGLLPVEIWKGGKRVHFGNEITSIDRAHPDHQDVDPFGDSEIDRPNEPLDVLSFLAEHGGLRDDEGHDLQGRGRLISGAISGRRRRGGSAGIGLPVFSNRGGFLFRRNGMSIDEAGELLHEAGYISGDRPTTAEVLDLLASSNTRPIYRPEDMPDRWMAEQAERYGDLHGEAVRDQVQGLEHDIRMSLEADPKLTVQIDGASEPISVARLLEDLDADDKALSALKACTVPGGTA